MPSPILPYHVQLILQYIAPPSELENPVPPHLLSRPLYQRHAFLEIEPSNAASYLCWKESAREKVIRLLESLPRKPADSIATSYSADEENTFAHVHIPATGPDGLRLVFDWNAGDASWRFHDAGLMPFPAGAYKTLEEAMSAANLEDESPDDPVSPQSPGGEVGDDSYWDSYGGPDGEGEEAFIKVDAALGDAEDDGEDAYWAQYSSVHGTADSTIPTPPRHHGKHIPAPDAPLPIPPAMMIRPRAGPRDPVSPTTLAARLGQISPRASLPSSAAHSISHSPVSATFHHHSSHLIDSVSHLPGMAEEDATTAEEAALSPPKTRERALSEGTNASLTDSQASGPAKPISPMGPKGQSFAAFRGGPEDDGVREVVRGAYRLWKAVHANGASREEFLRLVADATEGL
ncbi:hypothetical protein PENSPDRAFT_751878 [Peniophora sp. CONT]|nr:hypothetical protein PENSPDRAFT_751878 [Peniophora sp. CONT]